MEKRVAKNHAACHLSEMQPIPALPADPGLRVMVIFACFGIVSLIVGVTHGVIRQDKKQVQAFAGPLILLAITLSLGQRAQGFHVFIMAAIAALAGWGIRTQKGIGRWLSIAATVGLTGAVCCALLLF